MIQCGGVSERRIFTDGSILALFLAVGTGGGEIEGEEIRPTALRVAHTLNRWMQAGDGVQIAADQTAVTNGCGILFSRHDRLPHRFPLTD